MHSDQIVNRITDLLKLTGVSNVNTIEELTDHYLSHIEAEVRRGVNTQQAIRETYREIANLDTSQFSENGKQHTKSGTFLLLFLFVGIGFYLFQLNPKQVQEQINEVTIEDISLINPPTGTPIKQSKLKVSSEFGLRINPIGNHKELHKGIDIRAKLGTSCIINW